MLVPVRKHSIYIGQDTATGENLYLSLKWLTEKNVHVIGPPGEGKTRLLLWIFQCLCRLPRATVVLLNPKGAFARMARDWMLANGLTPRLTWFDPGDGSATIGYNPLLPNGIAVAAHAKAVRESIRSAWGQANFDETPQLARLLYLSLGVCRALGLNLTEAVQLLRSGSAGAPLRRRLLPNLAARRNCQFFHEALTWFDSLSERRQDELSASSVARLEGFVSDPLIGAMLTAPRSLDLGRIISEHRVLLVNLEIKRPLAIDDVRLLGRLITNDIVNHVFARPAAERNPVYFLVDECHQFLTEDLAHALDMGRELGLHVIASHQHLDQLRHEGALIYGSVMKSARVKMIFGDCAADDLDVLLRDAMIGEFDPKAVKDEITNLELDPVETTRRVVTSGITTGRSASRMNALTRGKSQSTFSTESSSFGTACSLSSGNGNGMFTGISTSEFLLPPDTVTTATGENSGKTSSDFEGQTTQESESHSSSSGRQNGTSASTSIGATTGSNFATTITASQVPFYEYRKSRVVTSRTFETMEEYMTKCLQRAKAQPVGHFLLKLPKQAARFIRAPYVADPKITARTRSRNLQRVYAQPWYGPAATEALPAPPSYQREQSAVPFEGTLTTPPPRRQSTLAFDEAPPATFLEEE